MQFFREYCDAQFLSNQDLGKHKLTIHDGVRYKCDQCSYEAKLDNSITDHKRSKHDGYKFPCPNCDFDCMYIQR